MNWPGLVFGVSLSLALIGTLGATFAERPASALVSLSAAMLGVGGVCLALGSDFIALLVIALLGAAVPSVMAAALVLSPVPQPDVRSSRDRAGLVAIGMIGGFGLLAWLLTTSPWVPAGGVRQQSVEWLGSRFLTDHLLTLELLAAMLALAGVGTVALLRGRRAGR